jgi:DNA-binding NtrC family response regulator
MIRSIVPPISYFPSSLGSGSILPPGNSPKIAIVDSHAESRHALRAMLGAAGLSSVEFERGADLLRSALGDLAVVCLALELADMPGVEVLQHLRVKHPAVSSIVVTAERGVEQAVEAMQAGAYDYLAKPFTAERVVNAVRRACERWALSVRVQVLESALDERDKASTLIGRSSVMKSLIQQIDRVVGSEVTVCLLGESGTGKELVARAIHAKSQRRSGPFVGLNCASIPASLQESELFGHERGAFTGAVQTHKGRFEQARGGVLFLDEVGEMSLATQASLLRTLEERSVRRVGGILDIPIDARIVCATHRDLRADVEAGRFREDLYFRLVVYPITLPPLRARRADIPLLVGHFIRKLGADVGRAVERIEPDALESLVRYRWPGNVRELQSAVHRAMLSGTGAEIELGDLPPEIAGAGLQSLPPPALPVSPSASVSGAGVSPDSLFGDGTTLNLAEIERHAIELALRATQGNVGQAAKLLGLGRTTLYRKLTNMNLRVELD